MNKNITKAGGEARWYKKKLFFVPLILVFLVGAAMVPQKVAKALSFQDMSALLESIISNSSVLSVYAHCEKVPTGTQSVYDCAAGVTGTGSYSTAVTWSVSPATMGAITTAGVFTPNAAASGTVYIKATSVQDPTRFWSVPLTMVVSSPNSSITSVSVYCGKFLTEAQPIYRCSPTVKGTGGYSIAVLWSVSPATMGTITSAGVFTPIITASGTATVKATSAQDPSKFGTTVLTLTAPKTPPVSSSITSVSATCSPSSIDTSKTATCQASVTGTGAYSSAVTWSVTPATMGTVTSAGVFTPVSSGAAVITATSVSDPKKSGSATVSVTSSSSPVVSVSVSCVMLPGTAQVQYHCSPTVKNSGAYSTAVTWSISPATMGTITSAGLFTPNSSGTVTVTATWVHDPSKFGSQILTVKLPPAPFTVTSVSATCSPSSIDTSKTATCQASVTGTGAYSSAVTWSVTPATMGTVTSAGVFTPVSSGAAVITATSVSDPKKSGSATVSVTPSSGSGSAALVAHAIVGYSTGDGMVPVTTNPIDTTKANFLVACHEQRGEGKSTSSAPTDSMGNTWTLANTINAGGVGRIGVWYTFSPATSAKHTFTFSGPDSSGLVMAFSGIASGPDQWTSDTESIPLMGTVTPTNPNELVVSCMGLQSGLYTATMQPPLIEVDAVPCNSCSLRFPLSYQTAGAYQIQTAAEPVTTKWAIVGSQATPIGEMLTDTFYTINSPGQMAITGNVGEGFVGTPYSFQMQHTGGVAPFIWSITSGSLPRGLTMSSDGRITGTPTQKVIQSPITFSLTDSRGSVATSNGLAVSVTDSPVTITTQNCPVGKQYQPYAGCALTTTGGVPPYTYTWSTSSQFFAPPEGLAVDSNGTLTGTPTGEGWGYVMSWTAMDSLGTVSAPKTIQINLDGDNTLGGCSLFPADSIFHTPIDKLPVDTSPAAIIGPNNSPEKTIRMLFKTNTGGIPFMRVPWNEPLTPVAVRSYQSYFTQAPIPLDAPIEGTSNQGGGDQHVLVLQTAGGGQPCKLWEMWASKQADGVWKPGSNALWNNLSGYAMPPDDNGTTDAAGLPITPLLVTADEVIGSGTPSNPTGAVQHPIRFSLGDTAGNFLRAHVWPATAQAGSGRCAGSYVDQSGGGEILQSTPPTSCPSGDGPAFGEIYRLKANVTTPACAATSPQAAIIIQGLRKYGMIYADRGGSGFIMGTPDNRWNEKDLACLNSLTVSNFEPVNVSSLIADTTPVVEGSTVYHVPSSYRALQIR